MHLNDTRFVRAKFGDTFYSFCLSNPGLEQSFESRIDSRLSRKYWRNIEQPETGRRLTQRKVSLLLL